MQFNDLTSSDPLDRSRFSARPPATQKPQSEREVDPPPPSSPSAIRVAGLTTAGRLARFTRGWAGTLVRLIGTVALMAFALRSVEWEEMAAILGGVDWRWWMLGVSAGLVVQVVAAIRWSAVARPIGFDLPRTTFVRRFFEGAFFSLCLPGSMGGDVVKAWRLSDTTRGRLLAGCTILADRLTGFIALAVLAVTALVSQQLRLSTVAAIGAGVVMLLGAMLAVAWAVGMLDHVLGWLPEQHRVRRFLGHLLPYQTNPSLLVTAIAWSMIVQMGGAFGVALVGRAVGADLPLSTWFSSIPLVALAMVLPISISGVGVREGGLAVLLAPYGVSREQAVAIGLLWFTTSIACGLVGGLCFLADRRPTGGTTPTSPASPVCGGR